MMFAKISASCPATVGARSTIESELKGTGDHLGPVLALGLVVSRRCKEQLADEDGRL